MAEEADTGKTSSAIAHGFGHLLVRPVAPQDRGPVGMHEMTIPGYRRTALLYVPESTEPFLPLVVMCHGAGGSPRDGMALLRDEADKAGLLLLAPGSGGGTWDVIQGGYGPDIQAIDAALHDVFARYGVDAQHLAIGGFSDGASYALSLGITNGWLFTHVLAFSPGFMAPTRQADSPRIFVSHGVSDDVLPIESCSRRLVPALQRAGYDVCYREFASGHMIPVEIRREAVRWFLGT